MALSSQVTRSGLSRRYMGSSRRRSRRWPWVVMVLGIAGVVFAIQWLSDDEVTESPLAAMEPAAQASPADAQNPAEAASAAGTPASAAGTPAPTTPAVPSITLGDQRPAATGSSPATSPPRVTTPAPAAPTAEAASAVTPQPATPTYAPDARSEADVAAVLTQGMELIAERRLVEGRRVLSDLLFNHSDRLAPVDAQAIRDTLTSVNRELVFSRTIVPGDPAAEVYRVQRGDMLSRIGAAYHTPYPFLEMINGIDARRLQAGQSLKVIRGPFHARVVKSDYRMDIILKPEGEAPLYVCSLPVGLGEADSTPLGNWIVEEGKKVKNPAWVNPRTNERYGRDDPANPIGDYWIALKGLDPGMEVHQGYGIHGTIDPDSVGQQMSMGCVRLRDADIELVFKLLEDGESTVEIVR